MLFYFQIQCPFLWNVIVCQLGVIVNLKINVYYLQYIWIIILMLQMMNEEFQIFNIDGAENRFSKHAINWQLYFWMIEAKSIC